MTLTIADIEAARRDHRRRACCARRCCRRRSCRSSPAPRFSSNTRTCRSPTPSRSAARWSSLSALDADERARGVIAMSAGNHAQAVAYHARAARHSGDHRDAGDDAVREGRGDASARRRGRAATARRVAEAQARARRSQRERGLDLGAPLRRPAHHRRAGHHRARNAGGRARSRRAGDPDRRRRADRRQRHRGARRSSPPIEIVGVEAALYPSFWNALHGEQRADRRRRRSPKASR